MIDLITVNYHSAELIKALLASVQQSAAVDYRVIVVNNSPDDRALQSLAAENVHILEAGDNLGFGGGCNLGLRWVYERDENAIAWLINPDTVLPPGTLENALQFCTTHPQLSIIGTVVREPDGTIWFAGGEFNPNNGRIVASETLPSTTEDYVETAWVTGCSLLINLQMFATCPQFDPAYFLYYEDFDFCRRYAQQGHSVVVMTQIQVIHQPSSITGRNQMLKLQHSTYSYLLTLTRHTSLPVVFYRLGRILFHAIRVSIVAPERAIAIIKGVINYVVRVKPLDQSSYD
ncbi:MAG: glycosyltransferase family 2 protein [Oscillatoriales cyanobacterium C42_A2020_001]|nr:glycosyltransferase family 2 protein [Leptolyngbyaceae cyanobacterium C42_A2020_001]